jgi:uncharacterized damage-inducible protein DinB
MSTTGQTYARNFMMHRAALLDVLEQIPAEKSNFQAWEGGMSFHKMADHLRGSSARAVAMMRGETPGKPEPSPDFSSALSELRNTGEAFQGLLSGASDEQLSTIIEVFGGRKMPVSSFLDFIIQHEAHHKGQVWMMARMIGLEPPMFVKLG